MNSLGSGRIKNNQKSPSLYYLFLTFIKIGSSSFGGHMSLISVLQNQMVDRDKWVDNETLLDGISLASILPGPFAVNVVTYVGYKLRGFLGALISMIAVIIPSFILVYLLSKTYFHYNQLPAVSNIFKGVLPGVSIVVLSVAVQISRKRLTDYRLIIMCIISGITLISFNSIYTIAVLMLGGGLAGYILFADKNPICTNKPKLNFHSFPKVKWLQIFWISLLIFIPISISITLYHHIFIQNLLSLFTVFSSMSLTLFGGGYVFIPFIEEIIVNNMGWLTTQEFVDGIAIGQITPGPIMISAAFIGYKVQGLSGSIVATIGMFAPSGILAIICSKLMVFLTKSKKFKAILKGIHAVAVGMIFAAVITIGKEISIEWQSALIVLAAMLFTFKFKWNAIYIIPLTGLLGFLLF